MNREDITRMALQAGLNEHLWLHPKIEGYEDEMSCLERFATLVAAAEREVIDAKYPIKLTHDEYNAVINAALADEREACAKVCDAEAKRVRDLHDRLDDGCIDALLGKELSAKRLAEAIRARGQG